MTEARTICSQNVGGGSECQDCAIEHFADGPPFYATPFTSTITMFVRGDEIKCQTSLSLRVLFPMSTSSFAIVSKGIFPLPYVYL